MLLEDEAGVVNLIVPRRVYEAAPARGPHGGVRGRRGTPRAPRGRHQRRRRLGRRAERRRRPAEAEVRQIEPPAERETGSRRGPRARRGRAPRALLRPGKGREVQDRIAEHMFCPRAVPSLAAMRLRDHKKSLSQHLLGAVDLALDSRPSASTASSPSPTAPRPPAAPASRVQGASAGRARLRTRKSRLEGGSFELEETAATYSPRRLRTKYHRR